MDRMKRIMALTVSILAVALLASASSWEGSAMMGSYGDFPPGGYFAACNSFPRNTAVEVTNLETGKTVTVIVVRGLDNPGVFMVVSAEAAEALGLRQGKITRVRAVEPRSVSSLAPSAGSRTALDADFNPRLLAAEELERMGYDIVEAPAETEAVSEPIAEPTSEPAAVAATATESAPGIVEPLPPVIAPLPVEPVEEQPQLVQDLVRPEPATAEATLVPVPAPEAPRVTANERPDAINGGKPKPVRTVVLPELPEPEAPADLAVVAPLAADSGSAEELVVAEPGPEILAMTLPVPDETPIRVSPSPLPRRFEAPAALPDVLDKPSTRQLAPEPVELSLVEPQAPGPEGYVAVPLETPSVSEAGTGLALSEPELESEESATAEVLGSPAVAGETGTFALAEPGTKPTGSAVAHELMKPPLRGGVSLASLAWPELEADEIPDVVLARLTEPAQTVPPTSLAEGEVIFPATERPSAVALETPSFGAAETRIALAAPEVEALDQAEVLDPAEPGILASEIDVDLAEADIASESPVIAAREAPSPVDTPPEVAIETPEMEEAPGEVVVVMEPTDLRPPVADAPVVAEQAPDIKDTVPVEQAPVSTAEVPEVPVAPPVSPVAATRPAMATGTLEKGKHYIQVGAYRTESVAADTVSVLRMDYVIVLETQAGSNARIWKIFVGPLGRDESGMALLRVRSLGFKDAFLKIGG
jgi:cell division protein FtsN